MLSPTVVMMSGPNVVMMFGPTIVMLVTCSHGFKFPFSFLFLARSCSFHVVTYKTNIQSLYFFDYKQQLESIFFSLFMISYSLCRFTVNWFKVELVTEELQQVTNPQQTLIKYTSLNVQQRAVYLAEIWLLQSSIFPHECTSSSLKPVLISPKRQKHRLVVLQLMFLPNKRYTEPSRTMHHWEKIKKIRWC